MTDILQKVTRNPVRVLCCGAFCAALALAPLNLGALPLDPGALPDASEDADTTFESQSGQTFNPRLQRSGGDTGGNAATEKKDEKKDTAESKVEIKVGGYVKLDAILSDSEHGGATGNREDLMVPGAIETSGEADPAHLNMHAKQSRFFIKARTETPKGDLLGHIEVDFFLSAQGNEVVSNSYAPRMRHAYLKLGNWLFGQTWFSFMNVSALLETTDLAGAGQSAGRIFGRQAMIRWDNGKFMVALENPETTLRANGGAKFTADDSAIPDITLGYTFKGDWGNVKLLALARRIAYDNGTQDDSIFGGGVNLTGRLMVGSKDDFRFSVFGGNAIGRYNTLNAITAGSLDGNGNIELTDQVGGSFGYRHFWGDSTWRSTFALALTDASYETANTGLGVTDTMNSASVNLFFTPVKKVDIGFEGMVVNRELENGDDGDENRFQFTAKYTF